MQVRKQSLSCFFLALALKCFSWHFLHFSVASALSKRKKNNYICKLIELSCFLITHTLLQSKRLCQKLKLWYLVLKCKVEWCTFLHTRLHSLCQSGMRVYIIKRKSLGRKELRNFRLCLCSDQPHTSCKIILKGQGWDQKMKRDTCRAQVIQTIKKGGDNSFNVKNICIPDKSLFYMKKTPLKLLNSYIKADW